jgi:uncharacterized protein (TIGR02594 family)
MTDVAPWIEVAERYLGQHEIAGGRDNGFIVDCLELSGLPGQHDETAWCRAFVNRCLRDAGMRFNRSAAALDVTRHPDLYVPCSFRPGCIVVFDRVDPAHPTVPHGHAAFALALLKRHVVILGGNQGNAVSIEPRELDKLHTAGAGAFYWPAGVP